MSRIGKAPISIPQGVEVNVNGTTITVKGKLGELSQEISEGITVSVEDGTLNIERASESKIHKANHGLQRALISNMVEGVSKGFTKELELDYTDGFFSFGFAALNYSHSERNHYRYKMEGFDDDWRTTDAQNAYAPYTNLPSGDYTFKVMGANNDGVWNTKPIELQVSMIPPWWQTWWARSIALVLFFSIAYTMSRRLLLWTWR